MKVSGQGNSGLEAASLPDLGDMFEDLEENWSPGRGCPWINSRKLAAPLPTQVLHKCAT